MATTCGPSSPMIHNRTTYILMPQRTKSVFQNRTASASPRELQPSDRLAGGGRRPASTSDPTSSQEVLKHALSAIIARVPLNIRQTRVPYGKVWFTSQGRPFQVLRHRRPERMRSSDS